MWSGVVKGGLMWSGVAWCGREWLGVVWCGCLVEEEAWRNVIELTKKRRWEDLRGRSVD